jgi:hypothetical protein
LNPVLAVEAGIVFARVARFGWLFGTSLTDDGKIGVQWPDTLEGSCAGEFKAVEEDGALHSKPIK